MNLISKQRKETGLISPLVEVVLKNGNGVAGYVSTLVHGELEISSSAKMSFTRNMAVIKIKTRDIKEVREATFKSLTKLLWRQYNLAQGVMEVCNVYNV